MSVSEIVHCPSGLIGKIRGMKVKEERILADRKLARRGGQVDQLLKACWLETLDPGPYDFDQVDWDQVLQGDRFYALLQLRALTYGPEYAFGVSCQSFHCRARIEWELDLNDLPVRKLEGAHLACFREGNRFETLLPDSGAKVVFRLMTGADEKKLPKLKRQAPDRMLSAMLLLRVVEIEGVEPRDKRRFLEDLSMRDADFLVDEFDRVDCGVETAIEIECPQCGAIQELELPFDQGFFMPGRGRTKRRRSSSSLG